MKFTRTIFYGSFTGVREIFFPVTSFALKKSFYYNSTAWAAIAYYPGYTHKNPVFSLDEDNDSMGLL